MNYLHLFNHAMDAWEDNLADWIERSSRGCLLGKKAWMVTGSYLQANWLRRLALSQGKAIFGIQFFDTRSLRKQLSLALGLPSPSFGHETLRILLEAATLENEYTASASLLDALDELASCGWLEANDFEAASRMLRLPEDLKSAVKQLISSEYWTPRVDLILGQQTVRDEDLSLGVYGLDAENLKNLNLLRAASKRAAQSDFWVAQPLGKESVAFQWIAALERGLQVQANVCPAGSATRPFENFLAHLQGGGERSIRTPEILVAERWHEQVQCVAAQVCQALATGAREVLVVAPENSSTGPALVHQLVSRGIAVVDEVQESILPLPTNQLQIRVAGYLAEEREPELFLRIVHGLLRSPKRYQEFREAFFRSFDRLQTRSVDRLITEPMRENFVWLAELEAILETWPEADRWESFQQRWELLLERLKDLSAKYAGEVLQLPLSTAELEPLWHEVEIFLGGRLLSARHFLKYLCELLAAEPRRSHPDSHHRYAKVVVAPPSKAHGTSWEQIILTDALADRWIPPAPPNSVLFDEQRMRLRSEGYFLAVGSEKHQVRQERFLQLAYHARNRLAIARYERDEKGLETSANDIATFAQEFLKAKVTRFHNFSVRSDAPPRFAAVWDDRLNPKLAFDKYFLNFREADLPSAPWQPSALESLFKTPATFAFKTMFGCQREFDRALFRSAQTTVGQLAHRWLQIALGQSAHFIPIRSSTGGSSEQVLALARGQLETAWRKARSQMLEPDLWWESILNRAFSLALPMLERAVTYFDPNGYYQSEGRLDGVWQGASAHLALIGRTDLLLSDLARLDGATVRIIDFKTSKQIRTFDLENGDGLQFLGYQLLARLNGARHVEPIVVAPGLSKQIFLPPEVDLLWLIDLLARLHTSQSFGRRPAAKWDATEKLPIATVPIAPAILEEKLALTWGG